ncbi:MAG: dockerin type I repeat-containing protein [Ruminococcus sp.]|nr:dockerin type I repeat-containing protein [Ruminococcus sp.]
MIKADGTLDTESDVFAEGESFNITVKAKGYENDLVFTYPEKSEEPVEYALGDVNGDNTINVTDITQIAAYIKGKKVFDEKSLNAADVNKDGKINVTDIIKIAAHIKGKKLIK